MQTHIFKKLVFVINVLILPACIVISPKAHAGSNEFSKGPSLTQQIQCGLWAGSNGYLQGCYPWYYASKSNNTSAANKEGSTYNSTIVGGKYAALGDSVAAGLGLPAASNATTEDLQCGRSVYAYPNYIAVSTGTSLLQLACSGATSGDLTTQQGISGPNMTAQLDAAFADGTPQLITITAGANDIHWQEFLSYCYSSECNTTANKALLNTYESMLRFKLQYALYQIAVKSAGTPPLVILTGYYSPLSSSCTTLQNQLTSKDISFLNSGSHALNDAIHDAVDDYPFAKYVSVSFSSHGLCSSTPWVQGLNDPAPLHPTIEGQQAIAKSIINALD